MFNTNPKPVVSPCEKQMAMGVEVNPVQHCECDLSGASYVLVRNPPLQVKN